MEIKLRDEFIKLGQALKAAGLVAVSYTHLDVYKRQLLNRAYFLFPLYLCVLFKSNVRETWRVILVLSLIHIFSGRRRFFLFFRSRKHHIQLFQALFLYLLFRLTNGSLFSGFIR